MMEMGTQYWILTWFIFNLFANFKADPLVEVKLFWGRNGNIVTHWWKKDFKKFHYGTTSSRDSMEFKCGNQSNSQILRRKSILKNTGDKYSIENNFFVEVYADLGILFPLENSWMELKDLIHHDKYFQLTIC